MKDLIPILSTFKRQKIGPSLLILQIAVTFMVLVNAIYMISDRSQLMARPIGVDESRSLYVLTNLQGEDNQLANELERDLITLKSIPGVLNATPITGIPLEGWGRYQDFKLTPDGEDVAYGGYFGVDQHAIDAMGLELIAGENFAASDIQTVILDGQFISAKVLITHALAEKLSPDNWRDILGKSLYFGDQPHEIVGVVKKLQNAWHYWSATEFTVLSSVREANIMQRYFVRFEKEQFESVKNAISHEFLKIPGKRIEELESINSVKKRSYREDHATTQLLTAVSLLLTIVTAFGIFGQTKFSVNRRIKQIGTRRALGASKLQIVRYFMLENIIISSIGVFIGVISAIVLNIQFVELLALKPVPISFLMCGALGLIVLGQIAVIYPANQAAQIPPAIATRGS